METSWTPEETSQLMQMIEEGRSAAKAARVMGRSRSAVLSRARRMNVRFNGKPAGGGLVRFSAEEDRTIREMAFAGKSGRDIAEALGRTRSSAMKRANRLGCKLWGKNGPRNVAQPKARVVKPHPSTIAIKRESRTRDPGLAAYAVSSVGPFVCGKPLMMLNANECRWPVNDAGRDELHLFCGHPTETSYCEHHASRAVQPRTNRFGVLHEPQS
ncbi:hypothetical protein EN858_14900 [Mesorhizobium sp. M4B.F.Ca.ET.215.01.1.1]|uniref:GcrA family cell cycle regulator n=1 Tax=unclassified Mesorhizobium TaxID=325217 RepID=UPI0010936732|nr:MULTISPECIES: GcrA family cell cycle regulator [unclassified Mesorhizobium]TGQ11208.1 hypothetical protein EN858_14900 [Mesorhizobium sp. M4B.F.Ca.ET.215.01.1.1]TGR04739.1 hypothetical protein EN846_13180 [Mesorhizobium sp. M4B.F.Ca.ET.203.01.1.1]